ncbi:Uncharacterised protein [Mycobacterium tuberculosis]|uniref:Uncharacterized protein n=1 Tax=Mycobacterium tuberculosis TaxID=1773 RepID=A0A0U0T8C7_MYCTX|nr:Uncharacterised protein [Mycobacterium tuberculosis]COX36918.1 Uncharacterised protein [Mycobacterium tuberculosis]CPC51641.1 Uncharacterised protein [Mycobacterium tuberculosis]
MPLVRTGETWTTSPTSSIWPFPRYNATLCVPSGP